MEREKFEDKIKNAFDQAEVSPTDNVWRNVELDLARTEGDVMRRRLTFFKMVAAASVIFAVSVGAMSLYFLNNSDAQMNASASLQIPAAQNANPSDSQKPQNIQNASAAEQKVEATSQQNPVTLAATPTEKNDDNSFTADAGAAVNVSNEIVGSQNIQMSVASLDTKQLAPLGQSRDVKLVINPDQPEADPVAAMMERLAMREAMLTEKPETPKKAKDSDAEKLWTSIGVAAGAFNPVASGASQSGAAGVGLASTSTASHEAKASGSSYSMGMNMGTRVSKRWVVQGGVNYLLQSSDYTANAAIGSSDFTSFRPASIKELNQLSYADAPNNTEKVVTTAPYNVNNAVRYLSVPVQAGYLIVDKKIGVQLNAGLSTDLFLQNTKTAETENIQTIDQRPADDSSPYRAMNFSGLVGTELSYRFAQRYRVSLNPGLRYPINSVYKSDLGIQSTPLTFDVGLRFRYIFH
jgi:hypothetical protein